MIEFREREKKGFSFLNKAEKKTMTRRQGLSVTSVQWWSFANVDQQGADFCYKISKN